MMSFPHILNVEECGKDYSFCMTSPVSIQGPPDDKRLYNSHVMVDDNGAITAVYRKIHLFDIDVKDGPKLKESDSTISGDQIVPPVPTPVGNVGLAIVSSVENRGNKIGHEL